MTSGIMMEPTSFVFAEMLTRPGEPNESFFRMRSFLELCSLLEAIILYEDIHVYSYGGMLSPNSFHLFHQLYKEGIIKDLPYGSYTYSSGEDIRSRYEMVHALEERLLLEHERPNTKEVFRYSYLFDDIELECISMECDLAYKPLSMRDMVKPISTDSLRAQSELIRIYDSLSLKLKEKQQLRFDRGYPYKFFIPPIVAIILERAKDVKHLPEAMMDMREEFKGIRKKFNQLEMVFCDDSYSLADVIEAEKELKYLSNVLLSEDERAEEARVAFLKDFGGFLIKSLLKMGIDLESLYKLLSSDVAEWVDRKHKRRGALLLLDVSRKYKSIKHYGALIEKVFGFTLTENDLRVMRHCEALRKIDLRFDLEKFSRGILISPSRA